MKFINTGMEQRKNYQIMEVKGIGNLPRDLIIEILSRLPAKDLCKFRCVSKSWQDLFTCDEDFVAQQIVSSKRNPLLLIRRYISDGNGEMNNSKITIELTSLDMQGNVTDRFSEVIDGPVQTFITCGPLSVMCCMFSLYVCNPSIRQVVRVPYPSNSRLYNIGFGFSPLSNEYKIVHLFNHSFIGDGRMGCEVFSFGANAGVGSGSWKRIGDCPFSAWTEEYPVCANGVIYWPLSSGWNEKSILSLDLEREEFSSISYPVHDGRKYRFLESIGLMGTLAVMGFSAEASKMDIWMLKNNRKSLWVMEYSINLNPLCPKFLIHCDDRSEEILAHTEQRDIVSYDLKSGACRRIGCYKATMLTYHKPCIYYGSPFPLSTDRT